MIFDIGLWQPKVWTDSGEIHDTPQQPQPPPIPRTVLATQPTRQSERKETVVIMRIFWVLIVCIIGVCIVGFVCVFIIPLIAIFFEVIKAIYDLYGWIGHVLAVAVVVVVVTCLWFSLLSLYEVLNDTAADAPLASRQRTSTTHSAQRRESKSPYRNWEHEKRGFEAQERQQQAYTDAMWAARDAERLQQNVDAQNASVRRSMGWE